MADAEDVVVFDLGVDFDEFEPEIDVDTTSQGVKEDTAREIVHVPVRCRN